MKRIRNSDIRITALCSLDGYSSKKEARDCIGSETKAKAYGKKALAWGTVKDITAWDLLGYSLQGHTISGIFKAQKELIWKAGVFGNYPVKLRYDNPGDPRYGFMTNHVKRTECFIGSYTICIDIDGMVYKDASIEDDISYLTQILLANNILPTYLYTTYSDSKEGTIIALKPLRKFRMVYVFTECIKDQGVFNVVAKQIVDAIETVFHSGGEGLIRIDPASTSPYQMFFGSIGASWEFYEVYYDLAEFGIGPYRSNDTVLNPLLDLKPHKYDENLINDLRIFWGGNIFRDKEIGPWFDTSEDLCTETRVVKGIEVKILPKDIPTRVSFYPTLGVKKGKGGRHNILYIRTIARRLMKPDITHEWLLLSMYQDMYAFMSFNDPGENYLDPLSTLGWMMNKVDEIMKEPYESLLIKFRKISPPEMKYKCYRGFSYTNKQDYRKIQPNSIKKEIDFDELEKYVDPMYTVEENRERLEVEQGIIISEDKMDRFWKEREMKKKKVIIYESIMNPELPLRKNVELLAERGYIIPKPTVKKWLKGLRDKNIKEI